MLPEGVSHIEIGFFQFGAGPEGGTRHSAWTTSGPPKLIRIRILFDNAGRAR